MALTPGMPIRAIRPDTIFIGSCTNSRITDLREAANILRGRKVAAGLRAMVVPGSMLVKKQAEEEGIDLVFKLDSGERSASTSNRNFEGRQGRGGRTHLVSPAVAAATAVAGHFATPQDLAEGAGKGRSIRRGERTSPE